MTKDKKMKMKFNKAPVMNNNARRIKFCIPYIYPPRLTPTTPLGPGGCCCSNQGESNGLRKFKQRSLGAGVQLAGLLGKVRRAISASHAPQVYPPHRHARVLRLTVLNCLLVSVSYTERQSHLDNF